MESASPRVREGLARSRGRILAVATVTLVVALGGLIGWQTRSGLGHVDRMMRDRSSALHGAVAREVRNVVRFGSGRQERLDEVLRAIAAESDVSGVLLERSDGGMRVAHGALPAQAARALPSQGMQVVGEAVLVAGLVQLVTSGCNASPTGCGCGGSCPAGEDPGLEGDYRLVVAFAAGPYLELRRSVWWQGVAGGALLLALGAALWLFARQIRRAGEMRGALAVADERARYLERLTLVAGGLAHEIKNPLGSLRGFAQLIDEAAAPGSKTAEYAGLMVAELDAINRRVDGLRHFARPSPPEQRPCRPADVVRRVTALLAPDLASRGLRLDVQLPPTAERETLGDEERLRELVVNLVINAIEASPQGGTVTVALRVEGEQFTLEVADQGSGIPAGERERAVRPFSSTKPGGMGLGLALAQRAVEDHGGRLEIDDAPGRGALLRARWPRRDP